MREHVPVILGADRDAGSLGSASCTSLGHRIPDLPQVGSDFGFLPLASVVIPLVTSADLHARISLSFVLLELVVRDGAIALWLVRRLLRRAGPCRHRHSCVFALGRCKQEATALSAESGHGQNIGHSRLSMARCN